jgi:hypothetical protein
MVSPEMVFAGISVEDIIDWLRNSGYLPGWAEIVVVVFAVLIVFGNVVKKSVDAISSIKKAFGLGERFSSDYKRRAQVRKSIAETFDIELSRNKKDGEEWSELLFTELEAEI